VLGKNLPVGPNCEIIDAEGGYVTVSAQVASCSRWTLRLLPATAALDEEHQVQLCISEHGLVPNGLSPHSPNPQPGSQHCTCASACPCAPAPALALARARAVAGFPRSLHQPGGVDSHVHIGQSASNARSADDWTTGTRGAISGGTTTVVAFAVQAKGKQVMPAVEAYYALADGQAHCDYSFHAIITDPTEEVVKVEVPKMVDFGISSVKVGREGSEHRPGTAAWCAFGAMRCGACPFVASRILHDQIQLMQIKYPALCPAEPR
jgi:hypothetical protein